MGVVRRAGTVGLGVVLATLVIGCSGDDGGSSTGDTTATVVTTTTVPAPTAAEVAAAVCAARPVPGRPRLAEPELSELSGLVALDSGLWAHNDSGDEARVFRLDEAGATQAVVHLEGIDAFDWEDMSGAGPSAGELFVGDIGDNEGIRNEVTVLRFAVPDPAPVGEVTIPADEIQTITLRYPDGPRDAETLLVDPVTRDLVIVDKRFGGASEVYQATEADWADGGAGLERIGVVEVGDTPLDATTAGDVGADGQVVALRTYAAVLVFPRDEDQSLAEALVDNEPCDAPTRLEVQGEAVTFTDEGYLTVSEGDRPRLNHFAVTFPVPGE
jgi:hypothetical protein